MSIDFMMEAKSRDIQKAGLNLLLLHTIHLIAYIYL